MNNNIIINKLVIEGVEYKRTLPFSRGLNVISGEMYSGKSLVLNLIDYLLGREHKFKENVQLELRKYCDKALLEIELLGQVLTVERNLWKEANIILIYFCCVEEIENYSPRIIDLDKYYEFLLEKINIPKHKLLKYKPHSKERILENISFRDLMRYVYIDQHALGTRYFMHMDDNILKNKNKFIFDILFEFVEYDEKNVLEDIKNIINEIEGIKRQVEGLKSYTQEMKLVSRMELQKLYNEYEEKIKEATSLKESVVKNSTKNKSNMDNIYGKTKYKLMEVTNALYELSDKQKDLLMTINSKKNLLQDYNREMDELFATREAYELITKQNHKYSCPICSTELSYNPTSKINSSSINDLIHQLKQKTSMVTKSITSTEIKVEELKKEAGYLEEEKVILERALDVFKDKIDAPYIAEIESVNKMLREMQQSKDKINEGIRILNKILEKEIAVADLEEKRKKLEEKQKELKIDEEEKKRIVQNLSSIYRSALKNLDLEVGISDANIDTKTYQPLYKNASVTEHDSGGILACMQIAYLTTILGYKKSFDEFKHPGFLMFDTVGKYLGTSLEEREEEYTEDMIMDPITYERLYKLFISMSEEFQIFVVDNIPHPISNPYIKYKFYHHGLRGLIDDSKNEKSNTVQ